MQQQHLFRLNILCLSLMTALPVYAENVQAGQAQEKQLDTIQVKAKKQKTRRDNEVTGLGKLVKTADTLSKEQVLDIRDLTRYDPGIAVVEQGRGASSGYSIRGMDKNRVSLTVDGLAQIQSYTAQAALGGTRTAGSSGAINEIEYENVKAVEISKGSNSVEQGSGALAGSVAFQTKTADDVIGEGRQWGIQSKTAYSGKNRGLTQSIALAGRIGGAEALLIHTGRRAGEIRAHEAAGRGVQSFNRLVPVEDTNQYANFIVEEECESRNYETCKANPKKDVVGKDERQTVSTRDYTGPNRFLADPLSYESRSWLFRPGFRFENKRHYIGGILERTQQTFDTRDMTVPAFLTKAVFDENKNRRVLCPATANTRATTNTADCLPTAKTVRWWARNTVRACFTTRRTPKAATVWNMSIPMPIKTLGRIMPASLTTGRASVWTIIFSRRTVLPMVQTNIAARVPTSRFPITNPTA
ncbi:TonB-dependent receptor plug domain protein [Neisseria lactamica ATCC 23970]|uniref:TonB-dependent receptor plug domain protein n=1 Tax=Neisseria lactamica ATCC 23970 TaxID=546265 RepID=D0WBK2_NEILA|nr:TonB-dependent receptor plug domain protein [Neisseria lactamica ATCC 23970]